MARAVRAGVPAGARRRYDDDMVPRSIVVGVAAAATAMFASAAPARATTCMRFGSPPVIDVPEHPVLIVEQDAARRFVTTTTAAGGPVRITRRPIGAFWRALRLEARANTTISVPALRGCSGPATVLLRATSGWVRDPRAPTGIRAHSLTQDGWLTLQVGRPTGVLVRMRVEWAYDPGDLQHGLPGMTIAVPSNTHPLDEVGLPVDPGFELVFVRLTPLLLDGSAGTPWEGWVQRDPATGALQAGQGAAPGSPRPRTCGPVAPWIVGEHPSFTYRGGMRTFYAMSSRGEVLATHARADGDLTRVRVAARDGEAFRIEPLPRGSQCPLDVRVARGQVGPRVGVRPAVTVQHETGPFTHDEIFRFGLGGSIRSYEIVHLAIDTSETTVASRYGNLSWHGAELAQVSHGSIALATSEGVMDWSAITTPGTDLWMMRVLLSPIRSNFEGERCEVWLVHDPQTGAIRFAPHLGSAALEARPGRSCGQPAAAHAP